MPNLFPSLLLNKSQAKEAVLAQMQTAIWFFASLVFQVRQFFFFSFWTMKVWRTLASG